MEKGRKYKLVSFNGTTNPDDDCSSNENYWILIGQSGKLINFSTELNFGNDKRVLIRFDQNLENQGLECHNPALNALWILKTDLERKDI